MIILLYWELGHVDGFISGRFWMDLLFYSWVDDRKLLRKPSSRNCFPLLLTMGQPGHLSDFRFLRSLRRCASPLAPEVKNILQLSGILRLRSRPRGKKAGRNFIRSIFTIVGNRPTSCGTAMDIKRQPTGQRMFLSDCCYQPKNLIHIKINQHKSIPSMPGFLLSNVRSLCHKCDELHSVALNNNSAVVAVSETWLNDGIPDSTVTFPGYTIHRRDRKGGGGGGVALYVCNTIKQIRLTHLEEEEHEALWVWFRPSRLSRGLSCIIAAVLYFPLRSSATAQPDLLISQYLDSCFRYIECNYQQAAIVILGETNKYKSETICSRHGLKLIVAGATRKASQLDSIFTNISSMYQTPEHLPPVGSSDHQTILLNAGNWPTKPIKHIFCRKRTPETIRELGLLMNTTDFFYIHEAMDPEAKVGAFTSTIISILDKTVPLKKVSITNTDKPWMTVQIKDLIKDRQCAFCSGNKTSYRKLKSIIAKKNQECKETILPA